MRDLYKSDIIRLAKPITSLIEHCVYFLINNGEIVYVGYSSKVYSRIAVHFYDKEFTDYHILRYETMKEALEIETHYIKSFKPIYNKKDNSEKLPNLEIPYKGKLIKPIVEKVVEKVVEKEEIIKIIDNLELTSCKINIPLNTYILKKDGNLYLNIKGQIFNPIKLSDKYYLNNVVYNHPTKIFGNVIDLIERKQK